MLKFLYENPPKREHFLPRKLQLKKGKCLLFGPALSGKTSLALEFLKNFKNFLYIDYADIRINFGWQEIYEFSNNTPLEIICIDNINAVPEILPKCENILLISTKKSLQINGFERLFLSGLDFEEFIAFSNKNSDESTIFSHFMNIGTTPALCLGFNENFLKFGIFSRLSKTAIFILAACTLNEESNFSALKIFNKLKQNIKISKDIFYSELENLYELGIINYAYNFAPNSRLKRLFFSDFALRKVLSYAKNPRIVITNMLFCELAKNEKKVYFTKNFDFYLPQLKTGILVLPFLSADLALLKAKKLAKENDINEIIIISNSQSKNFTFEKVKIKFMDFAKFAVADLEF